MGNGLLSRVNQFLLRVNWRGTLVFMLIRIASATVGLSLFYLFALLSGHQTPPPNVPLPAMMLVAPFGLAVMVAFMSGCSLMLALLSKVGVPYVGFFSIFFNFTMWIGDPMIWVLHKIRPQWVPVAEPGFFNPPFVWVLNE